MSFAEKAKKMFLGLRAFSIDFKRGFKTVEDMDGNIKRFIPDKDTTGYVTFTLQDGRKCSLRVGVEELQDFCKKWMDQKEVKEECVQLSRQPRVSSN